MGIELPTKKTEIVSDVGLTTMLLHGPPKIGKSTIANSFPNAMFVAAEEGLKFLEAYKVGIKKWEDFMELRQKIQKEKHSFKTIVIDTASALFKLCEDYVCRKHNIEHPSDEEWGKGWSFLRDSFQKEISPLASPDTKGRIRYGLLFLGHSKEVEVKGRVTKTKRTVCDLSGTARKVLLPMVDCIGYCGFSSDKYGEPTKKRIVIFAPSETIEAGDRTGKLPATIEMRKENWYKDLQEQYGNVKEEEEPEVPIKRPKKRA